MKITVKTTAQTGGLLYLINIVVGFFAIGYIPGIIVVTGDAAATAANLLRHETVYRLGLAGHVLIALTNIPLAVVFYRLFTPVSKGVTLLVVFFTLTGTAIEAATLVHQFIPLLLLKGDYLTAFSPAQLQAQAYTFLRTGSIGFAIALVFFGCYGLCVGYLLFRSTFFPRIIGLLMATGGACYVLNSFANFVAPAFARNLFPYILLPSGAAELSFCLWLLVKGVNGKKWTERQPAIGNADMQAR